MSATTLKSPRGSTRATRFGVIAGTSFLIVWAVTANAVGRLGVGQWDRTFWSALYVEGTYETFGSAEEATKSADAVVVGYIKDVSLSREVQAIPDWGDDGYLTFASIVIDVEKVLSGAVRGKDSALAWEAFVPTRDGVELLRESIPAEPVLLLLKQNPVAESAGSYVLLNPESYFASDGGLTRTALGGVQEWSQHWEGRPFDALVESMTDQSNAPSMDPIQTPVAAPSAPLAAAPEVAPSATSGSQASPTGAGPEPSVP